MLPLHYIAAYVQARRLTRRDDEGATAVEYGLLVSLIALVMIVGVGLFGDKLGQLFNKVDAKIVVPA